MLKYQHYYFFIIVLLIILNDNSRASYNKLPSTLWILNISFDGAFILNLPSILTAVSIRELACLKQNSEKQIKFTLN